MQPPNPAPVIRAATTPGTEIAISTIASSSGDTTSNRSRSDAWLAANATPTSARSPDSSGGDRLHDPVVLGHDVFRASIGDRVHAGARGREVERCDVTQRADRRVVEGDRGDGRLALAAPDVVLRAVELPFGTRVEDDESDVVGQRDGPPLERPAIEQDSGAGHAARLGELVHQAALDADIVVLRALAEAGQRQRIDIAGDVVEHRPGRGELDGGR